jgi:hypothetical protein
VPNDRGLPRRMMGSAGVDGSVELAEFDILAYSRESSGPLLGGVVIGVDDGNWLVGELERERTASEDAIEHRLCTGVHWRLLAESAGQSDLGKVL